VDVLLEAEELEDVVENIDGTELDELTGIGG
jgi:hypothetical protein